MTDNVIQLVRTKTSGGCRICGAPDARSVSHPDGLCRYCKEAIELVNGREK